MVGEGRIQRGWGVFGSDHRIVGRVSEVRPECVVVTTGILRRTDLFVPHSAVASIGQDRVTLNVPKPEVAFKGWQRPSRSASADPAPPPAGRVTNAGVHHQHDQPSGRIKRGASTHHTGVAISPEELGRRRQVAPLTTSNLGVLEPGLLLEIPIMTDHIELSVAPHVVEEVDVGKQAVREKRHETRTLRAERVQLSNPAAAPTRASGGSGASEAARQDESSPQEEHQTP